MSIGEMIKNFKEYSHHQFRKVAEGKVIGRGILIDGANFPLIINPKFTRDIRDLFLMSCLETFSCSQFDSDSRPTCFQNLLCSSRRYIIDEVRCSGSCWRIPNFFMFSIKNLQYWEESVIFLNRSNSSVKKKKLLNAWIYFSFELPIR